MGNMTLRRRFFLHNLLLVAVILGASAVSVWRLSALRAQVDISPSVYSEVRTISSVGVDAGMVQGLLNNPTANHDLIITHLNYAIGGIDQFVQVSQGYGNDGSAGLKDSYVPINQSALSARSHLQAVFDGMKTGSADADRDGSSRRKTVETAMNEIDQAASACIHFINTRQQSASKNLAENLLIIGLLLAIAVLAAVILSVMQYRLVIAPLQRLRAGVRQVADAQFAHTLDPQGMGQSVEFRELAAEFNRMAAELDGFYRRLEEQVRAKSLELVQSERLASVGFLAAGVAHEINNPLNIISGYAELIAKRFEGALISIDAETIGAARDNLKIIREEAFRCKEIIEKLLSLSRTGSSIREELDLATVARDVASMTKGLKHYRDRRLTLRLDPAEPLEVRANLTEMKQVLLNLTINALEAASSADGEVCIEGRRNNGWIEMRVTDNGRGMGPETLRHVFEPFFTARNSGSERGTGLGLSITHAIVQSHQGRIEAQSDGPGRGATFTLRLPAIGE